MGIRATIFNNLIQKKSCSNRHVSLELVRQSLRAARALIERSLRSQRCRAPIPTESLFLYLLMHMSTYNGEIYVCDFSTDVDCCAGFTAC